MNFKKTLNGSDFRSTGQSDQIARRILRSPNLTKNSPLCLLIATRW